MSDLTLEAIAQAVAMSMVHDLYDEYGDLVYDYVCRPDVVGAYELEGLVKDLTEDEAYNVQELTKEYLRYAWGDIADLNPDQPTLW